MPKKTDELVSKYFLNLNENDLAIWKYISNHKKEVSELTLIDLAKRCNYSKSSIHRFAQKISYNGFSELKYALKSESSSGKLDNNLMDRYISIVSNSMNEMKNRNFDAVFQLIQKSKKVFIYGTGTLQRAVAQEMRRVFLAGDEYFYVAEGVDEIDSLTGTLNTDDLVFIISLRGRSDNAYSFAKDLKIKGVPFITITSFSENPISHLSNENIFVNLDRVPIENCKEYSVLDPYFILVSILFLRYMEYKEKNSIDEVQQKS